MITAAFLAFAAYLFFGANATEKLKAWLATHPVDRKHIAGAVLVAAALASMVYRPAAPYRPQPIPPDSFSLRGQFIGPTASDDAAMLSALLAELADCLEQDGERKDGPRLKTGVAFDDLRIAAREARMKGESIGARQPRVRDSVHQFLDRAVGTSGGPVTAESRRAWVTAFRDLSRACAETTK